MPNVDIYEFEQPAGGNAGTVRRGIRRHRQRTPFIRSRPPPPGRRPRRESAKTKTRHEVSGSGKKLWRQKGTGRARMGSIRSPLWRHGGTTHGPQPRDYSYKLPRKMLLGALRSALSAKLRDGELKVIQEFTLDDHKTRTMAGALKTLEAAKTVLLVEAGENHNARTRFAQSAGREAGVGQGRKRLRPAGTRSCIDQRGGRRKLSESLA